MNSGEYYYSDTEFQLELDLQEIRRAHIQLLDEPDDEECFLCDRLRCRCAENTLTSFSSSSSDMAIIFPTNSSTDSISGFERDPDTDSTSEFQYLDFTPRTSNTSSSFEDYEYVVSVSCQVLPTPPPASSLPTPPPEWKTSQYDDLLEWVRASHPEIIQGGPDMPFPIDQSTNNEINLSWPPHPKSIWYLPKPRIL